MMFEPGSPTDGSEERTYRFISDPSHKENLSGRVRAACLTCRKKKIKCSGEQSCQPCREKGLDCEGLPKRKKPVRDVAHPTSDRKRKRSKTIDTRSHSPKRLDSTAGSDSGYDTTTTPRDSSSTPPPMLNGTMDNQFCIETWNLNDAPTGCGHHSDDQNVHELPDLSPTDLALSDVLFDWSAITDANTWWHDPINAEPQSLLDAARSLEGRAQSLRLLATAQATTTPTPDPIQCEPLPQPDELDFQYDLSDYHLPAHTKPAHIDAGATEDRTCDDTAPDRTPEYASWWDVGLGCNLDFLTQGLHSA